MKESKRAMAAKKLATAKKRALAKVFAHQRKHPPGDPGDWFAKHPRYITEEQDHEATLAKLDATDPEWDRDAKLARAESAIIESGFEFAAKLFGTGLATEALAEVEKSRSSKRLETVMLKKDLKVNDVVQINPENASNSAFGGCFLHVSEVKSWGVQGFVPIPQERGKPPVRAYYRCRWDEMELIGTAIWTPVDEIDEKSLADLERIDDVDLDAQVEAEEEALLKASGESPEIDEMDEVTPVDVPVSKKP